MDNNYGHRERLRKRFLATKLDGFSEHEILELLLSFTIVRRDCKSISKEILLKYNSLYNFISQSESTMLSEKYISERSIVLLKLIFELVEKELYKNTFSKTITISDNYKLLEYLKFSLSYKSKEIFKIIFLNTQNELLKDENLFFGTIDRSSIYIREIIEKVLAYNAKSIILVHNHPSGSLKPSKADFIVTNKIKEVLEVMDVKILDHIIISKNGYFSFLEEGVLWKYLI